MHRRTVLVSALSVLLPAGLGGCGSEKPDPDVPGSIIGEYTHQTLDGELVQSPIKISRLGNRFRGKGRGGRVEIILDGNTARSAHFADKTEPVELTVEHDRIVGEQNLRGAGNFRRINFRLGDKYKGKLLLDDLDLQLAVVTIVMMA